MRPCFMIDHMLIKLGKYLRILGFDAEWDSTCRTHELILRANREGRIFLTRNTRLPDQYPHAMQVMTLVSTDPVVQLDEVVRRFNLEPREALFTRCIRCNLELTPVSDKNLVRERVHPNVLERYSSFYTCPRCHTVFWKGSHVRNTCAKLRLVDESECIPRGDATTS